MKEKLGQIHHRLRQSKLEAYFKNRRIELIRNRKQLCANPNNNSSTYMENE